MPGRNVVLETGTDSDAEVLVAAAVSYFDGDRRIREVGFEAMEIVGVFGKNR